MRRAWAPFRESSTGTIRPSPARAASYRQGAQGGKRVYEDEVVDLPKLVQRSPEGEGVVGFTGKQNLSPGQLHLGGEEVEVGQDFLGLGVARPSKMTRAVSSSGTSSCPNQAERFGLGVHVHQRTRFPLEAIS